MNEQWEVDCTDSNISDELKAELGFVFDTEEEAEQDAMKLSVKYPDNSFNVRENDQ